MLQVGNLSCLFLVLNRVISSLLKDSHRHYDLKVANEELENDLFLNYIMRDKRVLLLQTVNERLKTLILRPVHECDLCS